MASKFQQLQSKACQVSQLVSRHGTSYYKQLLEQNRQYIQEPPTVEKCNLLSKQLFYTRLASVVVHQIAMDLLPNRVIKPNPVVLESEELYQYILETSVYPREPEPLKELRKATATHPTAVFGTSPDAGQLIGMLLKIVNPKKTIEVGVFTGYSLLLTALSIPPHSKIVAVDMNRETYEIGLPFIKKAGVEHKIDFIHSQALPFLDKLLEDKQNEGSFEFAYVDADKGNYINYHERMMKLVKVGGLVVYDNTLWGGFVAKPEESVPMGKREVRKATIEFNKLLTTDHRVEISHVPSGDGVLICKRVS